jgi:stearoyl-CoA desaturase (delta-9 desaturase)
MGWYEVDPNYYGIWVLARLGLARKIQVTKLDRKNPQPFEG